MELEPELTMLSGGQPWLRLRIANRERGRQYVVKSIPALLDDVEHGRSAGYGRFLTFCAPLGRPLTKRAVSCCSCCVGR